MSKTGKFDSVEKAKVYILAHPDESKIVQSVGSGFSDSTIARARAELIHEGKLAPSRKKEAPPKVAPSPPKAETIAPPKSESTATEPAPSDSLLDHSAMQALADMIDVTSSEEDDVLTRKRLIKQCLTFAIDPRLHPDTRMSATQMWDKLTAQSKARELGPGKPKTRADAVARLSDLNAAVGLSIWLEAGVNAFGASAMIEYLMSMQQETADEREVPAEPGEAPRSPAGTPSTPGSDTDVRTDDGAAGPEHLG